MKTLIVLTAATIVALATPAFAGHGNGRGGNARSAGASRSDHGGGMREDRGFGIGAPVYDSCTEWVRGMGWVRVC